MAVVKVRSDKSLLSSHLSRASESRPCWGSHTPHKEFLADKLYQVVSSVNSEVKVSYFISDEGDGRYTSKMSQMSE